MKSVAARPTPTITARRTRRESPAARTNAAPIGTRIAPPRNVQASQKQVGMEAPAGRPQRLIEREAATIDDQRREDDEGERAGEAHPGPHVATGRRTSMAAKHIGRDAGTSGLTGVKAPGRDAPGSPLPAYWTVIVPVMEEWMAQW